MDADLLAREFCEETLLTALDAEHCLPVRTLLQDTVLTMVAHGAQDGEAWVHMLCSLVTGSPVWRSASDKEVAEAAPIPQQSESLLEGAEEAGSGSDTEKEGDMGQKHGSIDNGTFHGILGAANPLSRGNSWATSQVRVTVGSSAMTASSKQTP
jgi:hypothetical protein